MAWYQCHQFLTAVLVVLCLNQFFRFQPAYHQYLLVGLYLGHQICLFQLACRQCLLPFLPTFVSAPILQRACTGPSPLINVNLFYLKVLSGNIRVCQGCWACLRPADGSIGHFERRPFHDQSGSIKTPSKLALHITILGCHVSGQVNQLFFQTFW